MIDVGQVPPLQSAIAVERPSVRRSRRLGQRRLSRAGGFRHLLAPAPRALPTCNIRAHRCQDALPALRFDRDHASEIDASDVTSTATPGVRTTYVGHLRRLSAIRERQLLEGRHLPASSEVSTMAPVTADHPYRVSFYDSDDANGVASLIGSLHQQNFESNPDRVGIAQERLAPSRSSPQTPARRVPQCSDRQRPSSTTM